MFRLFTVFFRVLYNTYCGICSISIALMSLCPAMSSSATMGPYALDADSSKPGGQLVICFIPVTLIICMYHVSHAVACVMLIVWGGGGLADCLSLG